MARFLLKRALRSKKIGHFFFWLVSTTALCWSWLRMVSAVYRPSVCLSVCLSLHVHLFLTYIGIWSARCTTRSTRPDLEWFWRPIWRGVEKPCWWGSYDSSCSDHCYWEGGCQPLLSREVNNVISLTYRNSLNSKLKCRLRWKRLGGRYVWMFVQCVPHASCCGLV